MKILKQAVLAGCLLALPAVTMAQAAPQAVPPLAAAPVDPERLATSRALMDQIMPPATRDQMVASIMASMMQAMTQPLRQDPNLVAAFEKEPQARPIFDRFIQRQQELGLELLKTSMPSMLDAMAHAYARRFTLSQLHEIATFFATPTGQVYLTQAPTVMSDPDVSAWMSNLMQSQMKRMPAEVGKLTADLKTLDGKGAKHGG
ncbi:MAG: DUF2059 domain-containing protein [Sphingomonas sp.]